MRNNYPNLVLAYHGCDVSVRDAVIKGESFKPSENPYDWLGNGIYFWENDEQRAYEWAEELKRSGSVSEPAVVGAVLDLGNCLNLLDRDSIDMLSLGYERLLRISQEYGTEMPKNLNARNNRDWLFRNLDCAVIETLHDYVKSENLPPYDSVRGLFEEGERAYPGSGFRKKTHVQICITNPNCIIGCFLPRKPVLEYDVVNKKIILIKYNTSCKLGCQIVSVPYQVKIHRPAHRNNAVDTLNTCLNQRAQYRAVSDIRYCLTALVIA